MFTFIETRLFTRLVQDYLKENEYRVLQEALMNNPEAGNLILTQLGLDVQPLHGNPSRVGLWSDLRKTKKGRAEAHPDFNI